ncbi:lycopene cyclase family protein [Zunongwangia endophytica]|uniref:Lycopene cyclase family protein n=1 Tax=Zunongwangia endophytica TaxID=1808945 RepID=A0ABV8HE15_9FLAO|nr:lycopene cyclase family protein [Zunongwangia endophytica]MDN3596698.1 lycopene cyclase family protein [Zunongwangia endophytica]
MLGPVYYYVIVGGGLAGLQLALRLKDDVFFKGKKIAIVDPSFAINKEKTWCYWEKNRGRWDFLISAEWSKGKFISTFTEKELELTPYSYKMLPSEAFFEYALDEIRKSEDISLIEDEITEIDTVKMKAVGKSKSYNATHFFDSRVSSEYLETEDYTKIYQHFKGYHIKAKKPVFNPDEFTMMDFRLTYKNSTSFTYILPFSETEALVEYTFFTPYITEEAIYDEQLKKYIKDYLKLDSYEILREEQGIIPMTDFPFDKENAAEITKIGTGGGWVKASTGYSFKHTEKKISKIIKNIKSGHLPSKDLFRKKFKQYDRIFLDVLARRNEKGEQIFTNFYEKNSVEEIFAYLDEETSRKTDLKIMFSLFDPEFITSFFRKLKP